MIILGKYDEFGPGMGFPSMKTDFAPSAYEGQKQIADYLRNGHVHMVTASQAYDVFTGERIGIERYFMDDGVFSWSSSLPYYVEKYNLRLPAEFERHVLNIT